MGEAKNDPADHDSAGADPRLTVEVLAELQAGLLDDAAAARVRRQIRADPEAARMLRALNQVRRDVAAVGAGQSTAPDPPPEVIARISAVLRSTDRSTEGSTDPPSSGSGGGAHLARPRIRTASMLAAGAGLCAAIAAITVGTVALVNSPEPSATTPATAQHITVSASPMLIPLSPAQILALLGRKPDFGPPQGALSSPLNDPPRLASCLSGLGYPASTPVLGARPIDISARPGVLLVLPGDTPNNLTVFAVALTCSAADTGLLADTQIPRP